MSGPGEEGGTSIRSVCVGTVPFPQVRSPSGEGAQPWNDELHRARWAQWAPLRACVLATWLAPWLRSEESPSRQHLFILFCFLCRDSNTVLNSFLVSLIQELGKPYACHGGLGVTVSRLLRLLGNWLILANPSNKVL